jgi:hypothetical protein
VNSGASTAEGWRRGIREREREGITEELSDPFSFDEPVMAENACAFGLYIVCE